MEIYVLQKNYTEVDPEGVYDIGSGGYEETYETIRDVIGVFVSLEDAVRRLVEKVIAARKFGSIYRLGDKRISGYEILIADTDTTDVHSVPQYEYEEMAKEMENKLKAA